MNSVNKIIIFLFFCITNITASDQNYWLVQEYEKINPKQKIIAQKFNKIVQDPAQAIKVKPKKITKIVMVYPGDQISDYWRRSKLSFQKRLDELKIRYKLVDYFTKPGATREQSKRLLNAIKDDTDYLIFTLDVKKHSKFIERIISNKKPKLILQNITTPLKKWGDKQPFFYVGFDHVIGTMMLADYYLKNVNNSGKYAVLYGTNGYVSSMRGDEFIKYMKENSQLQMVDSYYTNYNKRKAMAAAHEILDNNENLDFIYACSTDIALGVVEVLEKRDLIGKVKVNGWGGGSSELEAIEDKKLDVTVMRMNDDNGVAMAEAIKLDLEGKQTSIPQVYSGDFRRVEKGLNHRQLEKLKDRAFRYTK